MSSCECTQRNLDANIAGIKFPIPNPRWLIRSFGFLSLIMLERCWNHRVKQVNIEKRANFSFLVGLSEFEAPDHRRFGARMATTSIFLLKRA